MPTITKRLVIKRHAPESPVGASSSAPRKRFIITRKRAAPAVVSKPCPRCKTGSLVEVLIPTGKPGYYTPPEKFDRYHIRCNNCRTYRYIKADKYPGIDAITRADLMGGIGIY